MKNKLSDLKDHLFAQIERLNDETLSSEDIDREIKKSKAMSSVASQINKSAALVLQASKMVSGGFIDEEAKQRINTGLLG